MSALISIIGTIAIGIIGSVIFEIIREKHEPIVYWLTGAASSMLPYSDKKKVRYAEEYAANALENEGPISRIAWAIGCLRAVILIRFEYDAKRSFAFGASKYSRFRSNACNQYTKLFKINNNLKLIKDMLFATIALIIFAPLMILISLVIIIESPGPIIFKQKRYGYNNKIFEIYKFRSMTHTPNPEGKTVQVTKDDSRVTKVGKFIRKTSLDELPQIFNVLDGSMSLVGPRPHAVDHNEDYAKVIEGYFARHRVKPGITGWAQINGFRGITDTVDKMENRVKYDVYYAENWSLMFDLQILLGTLFVGFINKNAH